MKKSVSLFIVTLVGLMLSVSAIAQTPVCPPGYICTEINGATNMVPSVLPVQSEAVLKAYALTLVNNLNGSVWGQSVSGQYWFYLDYTPDADPAHMNRIVRDQRLSFSVDPLEKLQLSMGYQGTVQNVTFLLFSYYTNFTLEKTAAGSWKMPSSVMSNELAMSDFIPFPVPNAAYAHMNITDTNGNPVGYYDFAADGRINTDYGFIMLGREHLGHNGTMVVGRKDGSKITYGLGEGKLRIPTDVTTTGLDSQIAGVRSLADDTATFGWQPADSIVRVGYSRAANVNIVFPAGTFVYPRSVNWIDLKTFQADPSATWQSLDPWKVQARFPVTNGVYLIRFEYDVPEGNLPQNWGKG